MLVAWRWIRVLQIQHNVLFVNLFIFLNNNWYIFQVHLSIARNLKVLRLEQNFFCFLLVFSIVLFIQLLFFTFFCFFLKFFLGSFHQTTYCYCDADCYQGQTSNHTTNNKSCIICLRTFLCSNQRIVHWLTVWAGCVGSDSCQTNDLVSSIGAIKPQNIISSVKNQDSLVGKFAFVHFLVARGEDCKPLDLTRIVPYCYVFYFFTLLIVQSDSFATCCVTRVASWLVIHS